MQKVNLLDFSTQEMQDFLAELGEPRWRTRQIADWIWHHNAESFAEMTNLPLKLRMKLNKNAFLGRLEEITRQTSGDGTVKLLLALPDRHTVETVILPYKTGESVCLSTQVGCRMGCLFCASGLRGLLRNLTPGEILAQLLAVRKIIRQRGRKLKNMVLMGTGEPLDNWKATVDFLKAVSDPQRLGMSLRKVTVSTAGLVPKILELARWRRPVNLAVSLHAANNETRSRLMPINNKYPLEILIPACDKYTELTGRRVTYEYVMIKDINDQPWQAEKLVRLLLGRNCHLNLIALNHVAERELEPSPQKKTEQFRKILERAKINVTVRRRMGSDIAAACGQLRNTYCKGNNKG